MNENIPSSHIRAVQRIGKCSKCKMQYAEHPVISRDDNKSEICPRCGAIEVLKALIAESEYK